MKILLDKSTENIKAHHVLFEHRLYSASIHCAYYSCLQLIKYILYDKYNGEADAELEKREGSHNYLINKLRDCYYRERRLPRCYNDIYKLKSLRIKADYSHLLISQEHSLEAQRVALEITNTLKEDFAI